MECKYSVYSGDEPVGTAWLERSGLYCRVRCRCKFTGQVPYKILLAGDDKQEDLGICVPMDGAFGLATSVPTKRMPQGKLTFRAVPRHSDLEGRFVPVSPEEPFRYLTQLNRAYMRKRDGLIGVVLPED